MQASRASLALATTAIALAFLVSATAQQVRDNAQVVAGTATISGKVLIDGPTKQPARRVRVTLTDPSRIFPGQTTTTDDTGSFLFSNLPAGRFEVQAVKAGYLRGSYGSSRPERAGTPIVVKDGERIANVAVTIARGGVITGVVRDTRGRPVPGINVRVLRFGFSGLTGERTLGAPSSGSSPTTDDRGEYRAYGLPPGNYLVLANAAPDRSAGSGVDDIRVLTSAELQQAMRAARGAGPNAAPAAQPSTAATSPSPRVNYAPVFHPGVTDIAAAATIALGLSEERGGADITVRYVPTATIAGKVTDPSGAPLQMLRVALSPNGPNTEMLAGAGLRGANATLRPDGTFVFSGVAPGSYTVKANTGPAGGGRGLVVPSTAPSMWASADVIVNGRDLDVPLVLQRGVTINGRVVFEGEPPAPADLQALVFRLVPPGSGGMIMNTPGRVDAEGKFTLVDVTPDAYQFVTQWGSPAASGKWAIKSSVANGRDAYDAPLLVTSSGAVDWIVTYTDKPAVLSGVFVDRGGRAATDYYILVFPTDRKYWTPGTRRVRTTRPGTDGAFSVAGLPPGEYFLGAMTDLEQFEWNDPALLETLVPSSAKVTLREGETTRQDLRIGG